MYRQRTILVRNTGHSLRNSLIVGRRDPGTIAALLKA
jgi:hypothetical protein